MKLKYKVLISLDIFDIKSYKKIFYYGQFTIQSNLIKNQLTRMGIQCMKAPISPPPVPAFTYKNMIKYNRDSAFDKDYELLQLLGRGSYAEVRKTKFKKTGRIRAVKIIDRNKHSKIEPLLLAQFDVLKEMDHPNILKIYEIYEQKNYYFIVTELCYGKQLFNVLQKKKNFSQIQTFKIFYQLASAVQYLHSRQVMHRDLKPQNIMYDQKTNLLKLIDFGSSLRFDNQELIQRRKVGTIYYVAPEVINRCYNHKCDIWSLGVILYILLCGEPPFPGKDDEEILNNIKIGEYDFKKPIWTSISSEAKMLITQMMVYKPEKRPSMDQVMRSDWIRHNIQNQQFVIKNTEGETHLRKALQNLQKFQETKSNNIQGAVLVFIVNFIKSPEDEAKIQQCFKQLDLNGDGVLSLEQLAIGIKKYLKITEKQAKTIALSIFKRVDTNNSGFIDYSQFLVAANSMEVAATEQNFELAFDCMDEDKNGYLSAEQIKRRLGDNIPLQRYEQMLKQYNLNKNGEISKSSFVSMMGKLLKYK